MEQFAKETDIEASMNPIRVMKRDLNRRPH